jgi:hypothetical protein
MKVALAPSFSTSEIHFAPGHSVGELPPGPAVHEALPTEMGVNNHTAPTNSSASACSMPLRSLPAIG